MGDTCSAINCNNRRKLNPELSFFRFPKDPERGKKWLHYIGREDLLDKTIAYLYGNIKICANHFEISQFMNENRNKLIFNAVPTLFDITEEPPLLSVKRNISIRNLSSTTKKLKICKEEFLNEDSSNSSHSSSEQSQQFINEDEIDTSALKPETSTEDDVKLNKLINSLMMEVENKSAEIDRLRKRCEHLERLLVTVCTQDNLVNRVRIISDHNIT